MQSPKIAFTIIEKIFYDRKGFLPYSEEGSEMRDERYAKQHVFCQNRKRFSVFIESCVKS